MTLMAEPTAPPTPPRTPRIGAANRPTRREGRISSRFVEWLVAIPGFLTGVLFMSWLANRPPSGPGSTLIAAGQLTGLGASMFALVTVALMARVPILTNAVGNDTTIRWHRWMATITMVLLPIHVVTTTVGYAAASGASLATEIADLLTVYPDMLTATAATVLLTVISLTSIRSVRRRMRYQSWLFLHWYSYLAVALAFGHTLSDGASFVGAPWPSRLWLWLHLAVAGLVAWYRILLPAWLCAVHPLTVTAVRPEGPGMVSLTLTGDRLDGYKAKAGQHVRVRFLTREGWWQSHPMSLSAAPTATTFRITVATDGDHTDAMQRTPIGTRAVVSGVYGNLTADARITDGVVLIGGGSGIAPLRTVLEELPTDVDVRVLYRAHSATSLMLQSELDWLASVHRSRVDYLVGQRSSDPRTDMLSPESLRRLVPDIADRDAYVCGRSSFVATVVASLRSLGVHESQLHTERFDG